MATRKKSSKSRKSPWNKPAPKSARHRKLAPAAKSRAKSRAKRAGRRYPNLVDNMRAAAPKRRKSSARKRT